MNNLITAIIIDDEKDAREGLEALILENTPEVRILGKANNASDGLNQILSLKPDLVFLDVEMPGKSGLGLVKDLKINQIQTTVIFVTAFNKYAIEAIKFAAFDYLLKPVDTLELKDAINRYKCEVHALNLNEKIDRLYAKLHAKKIKLLSRNKYIFIDPHDIVSCEADGNYCYINLLHNEQEYVTMQLGKLEKILDEKFLVRVSRTFLINISFIKEINPKSRTVLLQVDDDEILIKASRQGMNRLNKQCS